MIRTLRDISDFFFPRICVCCGKILSSHEDGLCFECLSGLPYTGLQYSPGNEMERMFWGVFPIEKATSLLYYSKGGNVADILHAMKYKGRKKLCCIMGRIMAAELMGSGFFENIDLFIPVPLHKVRMRNRGYNQSELLAKGISDYTGIPIISDAVKRTHNNTTQTRKSGLERWQNTEGLFALSENSSSLKNKHILIIDDVLTTGATISSCMDVLKEIDGIKISVATLAWTK